MRYLGLLENIRVRRVGFVYRVPYDEFLSQYRILSSKTRHGFKGDSRDGCAALLERMKISSKDSQFGTT